MVVTVDQDGKKDMTMKVEDEVGASPATRR